MKLFGQNIHFHRPEFLKSDDNPRLKSLFHKPKDDIAQQKSPSNALKMMDRGNRHRLFGGLVSIDRSTARTSLPISTRSDGALMPLSINMWRAGKLTDTELIGQFTHLAEEVAKARSDDKKVDSEEFLAASDIAQVHKEALFESVRKSPEKLKLALRCANEVHGKPANNENIVKIAGAVFDHPAVKEAFDNYSPRSTNIEQLKSDILEAASLHGLADRDVPVNILATKRFLTPEERQDHIAPRSVKSAQVYAEYGFPAGAVSEMMQDIKVTGDASINRSLGAQFLNLMDDLNGMAPKFQKDGKPDYDKIFGMIATPKPGAKHGDVAYFNPNLVKAVKTAVQDGAFETGMLTPRPEHLFSY